MLMLEPLYLPLVLVALIGSGLIAGVFFAFSAFVMKAFSQLSPEEGIRAMQSINVTILRSYFIPVFLGTAVICVLLLVWSLLQWNKTESEYVVVGSVLYLLGSLMVTGVFNVPKNEVLAKVNPCLLGSENIWNNYLGKWTFWNHIRTLASLLATICFGLSLY